MHTQSNYIKQCSNGAKSDTCAAGFILICMPSKFAFAARAERESDKKRWQQRLPDCLSICLTARMSKSQVNVQIFTLKYANMAKTECEHFRTLHLKLRTFFDCELQLGQVWPGQEICHLRLWANLNGKQMPDMAKFKTETFAAHFQCQQKAYALPTKSLNFSG